METVPKSELAPTILVTLHQSRVGPYLAITQGAQSVTVDLRQYPTLVKAMCVEAGDPLILEIGDRKIVAPGPLGLPPGEYTLLVLDEKEEDTRGN